MKVKDFAELGLIFDTVALRLPRAMKTTAKDIGEGIERRARGKLGEFQDGWPRPLAPETQRRRKKDGYPPNEPLLVEGVMRASIHNTVRARAHQVDAFVGSDAPQARRQELGYGPTPARAYLSPAAVESADDNLKKVEIMLESIFTGSY
jgi:hypothetical protein